MAAHHFFVGEFGQSARDNQVEKAEYAADKPNDGVIPARYLPQLPVLEGQQQPGMAEQPDCDDFVQQQCQRQGQENQGNQQRAVGFFLGEVHDG